MSTDPFLALQASLERDLAATGFSPENMPPAGEPRVSGRLSGKSEEHLKDLYDDLLDFYDYLSDQITRCVLRRDAAKARSVHIRAKAAQAAAKLPNAEARKNAVEVDPDVVESVCDYLYYRQMWDALEERRRKISKNIERVSRELFLRNSRYGGGGSGGFTPSRQTAGRPVLGKDTDLPFSIPGRRRDDTDDHEDEGSDDDA